MAVLFSAVNISAGNNEAEFLVAGIPREYEDLEGWTAFDDLMEELDTETEVQVHVEAYTYGDQETYKATPEEIAYFMKRMEQNENFLSDYCDNIEDADFSFVWSPDELFNMEIE